LLAFNIYHIIVLSKEGNMTDIYDFIESNSKNNIKRYILICSRNEFKMLKYKLKYNNTELRKMNDEEIVFLNNDRIDRVSSVDSLVGRSPDKVFITDVGYKIKDINEYLTPLLNSLNLTANNIDI
jgi:hypothetical protein